MAKKRTIGDLIRDEVQQSLFDTDIYSGGGYSPDWELDSSGASYNAAATPVKVVLEQPPNPSAPEQKHWVEIYTGSKRKAYYYYRYVWMEGRKLHHIHIGGNALYARANATKEMIEEAIALGNSPAQIITLIKREKQHAPAVAPRQTSP